MATKKVLMIATSQKTRGGITAVLKSYQQCEFWDNYQIKWLETHRDKSRIIKFAYALKGLLTYVLIVHNYDIVHIHTSELPSVQRKYIFLKIAKLLKKKVIVHLHIGNQIDDYKNNPLYKSVFSDADTILVLSESIKKKIQTLFAMDDKVKVLYNPCLVKPDISYTDRNKTIIYAGTLNKNKGYSVLIEAFSSIAASYPEWKLQIAGNGEINEAKALVKKFKLENQVEFLGWVKDHEKDSLFRNASIFCLPSFAEGFPMAVLDAWTYAIPVVATPVGGLPDVLNDGIDVLFFAPGNTKELAQQLCKLISDGNLRNQLSSASHDLSMNKFSLNAMNSQMSLLYNNLLFH